MNSKLRQRTKQIASCVMIVGMLTGCASTKNSSNNSWYISGARQEGQETVLTLRSDYALRALSVDLVFDAEKQMATLSFSTPNKGKIDTQNYTYTYEKGKMPCDKSFYQSFSMQVLNPESVSGWPDNQPKDVQCIMISYDNNGKTGEFLMPSLEFQKMEHLELLRFKQNGLRDSSVFLKGISDIAAYYESDKNLAEIANAMNVVYSEDESPIVLRAGNELESLSVNLDANVDTQRAVLSFSMPDEGRKTCTSYSKVYQANESMPVDSDCSMSVDIVNLDAQTTSSQKSSVKSSEELMSQYESHVTQVKEGSSSNFSSSVTIRMKLTKHEDGTCSLTLTTGTGKNKSSMSAGGKKIETVQDLPQEETVHGILISYNNNGKEGSIQLSTEEFEQLAQADLVDFKTGGKADRYVFINGIANISSAYGNEDLAAIADKMKEVYTDYTNQAVMEQALLTKAYGRQN